MIALKAHSIRIEGKSLQIDCFGHIQYLNLQLVNGSGKSMEVDKVGWGMLSAVGFPTTRAWFVSLQRRRVPARTRLSNICGGIAGGGADGGGGSGEVEGVPRAVPQVDGEELAEEGGRLP